MSHLKEISEIIKAKETPEVLKAVEAVVHYMEGKVPTREELHTECKQEAANELFTEVQQLALIRLAESRIAHTIAWL